MRCDECGQESDVAAHGWKAFVTHFADGEESKEPLLVLYCPACAAREFGEVPDDDR
jgi:hypothetical protein